MPILSSLRLTVKPGVSRSTRNIEMPSVALARRVPCVDPRGHEVESARAPLVMNILEPLST